LIAEAGREFPLALGAHFDDRTSSSWIPGVTDNFMRNGMHAPSLRGEKESPKTLLLMQRDARGLGWAGD
jgi:hypothetical protein